MSKPFRLGDYFKPEETAVPKLNTERIEYLKLDCIEPDPDNFYSLEGIEDLAENIELVGLLDPIRVRPAGARYVVVSGHRRRAACMMIRDGGNPMFDKGVPCIVEHGSADDDWRRLRLIFANSHTRVLSPAEISRQADEVLKLLTKLKASGVELPGRMREHVAEALNVSSSKLGRVQAIRRNLVPEFLKYYDAGTLNEAVAYRISQESRTVQLSLAIKLGPAVTNLTAARVDDCIAALAPKPATETMSETDGDTSSGPWGHLPPVKGATPSEGKADDENGGPPRASAPAGETKASEARQPWKKDDEEIQRNRELWARVAERRKQCGLSITEAYQTEPDEEKFWRDYETGKSRPEFPPHVELSMDDDELCDFADRLFCSIDFLLGRTEIPETAETFLNNLPQPVKAKLCETEPAFASGTPPRDGRYLCRVKFKNTGKVVENTMEFKDRGDGSATSSWILFGSPLAGSTEVVGWYPLPEKGGSDGKA